MTKANAGKTGATKQAPAGPPPTGGSAAIDGGALAAELRTHRDWRKTSAGPAPDLSGIDLSGQDLRGVDFSGAVLRGADFTNAKLADAKFAWARLAHANFTGATGVLGSQFARADLRGARMPPEVRFGAFESANEIAEVTGKLFLTLLLVCAYSWLTINSTLDDKLLTDTGVSKLPILNAEIPIVNFYALVPVGLVALAVVAMLQAQRLWAAIAGAPQALPDGTLMADRSTAWILGPWAAERVAPHEQRGPLSRLQALLAVAVGWWLVPVTIVWFWARYLHRHDWTVTALQVLALTVTCVAAAGFLRLANATVPRRHVPPSATSLPEATPGRQWWRRLRPHAPMIVAGVLVPLAFGTASYAAIHGVHAGLTAPARNEQGNSVQPALALQHTVPALQVRLPELMSQVGLRPVAQLSETEVSTRLGATGTTDTMAEAKATGARLIGADLRFAAGERVYLARSDLRRADLLGADFWWGDLRGANLVGASLVGSLLFNADMRKVRANAVPMEDRVDTLGEVAYWDTLLCSRASFAASNLRYARLVRGDFRGASFDAAKLQGATFEGARLQHATFIGADLDGADFRGAVRLQATQILAARHIYALYDPPLLAELQSRAPTRLTGYDADSIAKDTEMDRLSGEDEPDSLDAGALQQRDSLIRAAFDAGVPNAPDTEALARWVARGRAAPGSADDVPAGCVMTRLTAAVVRPRPAPRP